MPYGWSRYTGSEKNVLGITTFGASAPGGVMLEKYGFTVAKVADGEDFGLVRPDSPRWIITAVKQYTQEGKE